MCNEKTAEMIRSRLQELEVEREELLIALRVLERFATGSEATVTTATVPAGMVEPMVYPDVSIDFTGASNLLKRLIRIAEAVDGPLEAMDMAVCLIQRGVSGAARRNLRSHVINQLRDDPSFEKTGPGQYRYMPKAKAHGEAVTLSIGNTSNPS